MQVRSLDQEHPLGEEMATHSSILAWRIPGTEKPGGLQSTGLQRVGHDGLNTHTYTGGAIQMSYHVNYEEVNVKINCENMDLTTFSLHVHVATELIFSHGKFLLLCPV